MSRFADETRADIEGVLQHRGAVRRIASHSRRGECKVNVSIEIAALVLLHVFGYRYLLTLQHYMIPLKSEQIASDSIVDTIFYKVNELYMHHATFLSFLENSLASWTAQSTIGDVIHKMVSTRNKHRTPSSFAYSRIH